LQVLEHPRLITEQEDVHLIETFLISTKQNKNGWAISKNAKTDINEWVGKDFVIIPESIFNDPHWKGHTADDTTENEMAEIQKHSHGKITKIKGPYKYEDGTDDYYYNAIVKLNDKLSASALIENGEKTWVPFAVSPQIIRTEGPRDDVLTYTPMGLFLVLEGAYGEEAVVDKMCSGSALSCGTALKAAIMSLNHNTNDAMLAEVINSYISSVDNKKIEMSNQVIENKDNSTTQAPIQNAPFQVQELKKNETISFTKDEYDALIKEKDSAQKLADEVADLKKERDSNILNTVFGSIEDEKVRSELFESYSGKDTKLVKKAYDDIVKHVLPKKIEEFNKVKVTEVKEEKASVLKKEPKINDNEELSASVQSDDISISEARGILGL